MPKSTNKSPENAPVDQMEPAKAASLYRAIEAVTEDALKAGDHTAYATLHPVVVALAGVKFAASQASHAHVSDDAKALLDRIKAL